jgi:Uma2 family endonuclease
MATTLLRPRARAGTALVDGLIAALPDLEPGDVHLFEGVPWAAYERLLVERDRLRPSVRLTYDHGSLEVMTVTNQHERWKKVLARMVETLALELEIPLVGSGNLTIRREDLARGLEPDECFYVRHAVRMAEIRELDFTRDPPFDLVIEIEYSRRIDPRLSYLGTLGVPEIWRYDGSDLRILVRQSDGGYTESATSLAFPQLPLPAFVEFLHRAGTTHDTALMLAFRAWVRETLLPPPPAAGGA